ncbi:MAG: hypothetical protein HC796_00915, partial [Synechococcaceae cyanobacterium RL_1_2]|nr:hypothetical protein [Synechococcaceae cyanobacterium RL_1_2]
MADQYHSVGPRVQEIISTYPGLSPQEVTAKNAAGEVNQVSQRSSRT